ncbi:Non-histone chromosomal protein 6 [Tulasnella sp. 424]|nr:Non-histone chromosomal protein 6 [Tulasnella sp. 424]
MVRKVVVEDRGLGLWGYHGGRSPENVLPVGALGRFPKLEELEFNLAIHSFSTLLPLQNSFQRLICISIGPNYYATCWMSQQTLPQLAALLPRIEELRILDDRRRITTVSLQTLQCFAVSCRHLRKLRIPIYDRSTTGTAHIQPHPSIREIDFRYSTIATDSDTEAVARTIAAMFPSLVSFGYIGKYDRASDWEDVAGALVQLLPGLKVSAPDDDMPKEAKPKRKAVEKTEAAAKPKRGGKAAAKGKDGPKRPLSAFMYFCKDWRDRVKAENPEASFGEVGKLLGAKWKELDDSEKIVSRVDPLKSSTIPLTHVALQNYTEQAAKDKARYEGEKDAAEAAPKKRAAKDTSEGSGGDDDDDDD